MTSDDTRSNTTTHVGQARPVYRDGKWVLQGAGEHPCLTIAAHPDPARLGERRVLFDEEGANSFELARNVPKFDSRALDDAFLSRKPIRLQTSDAGVLVTPNAHGSQVVLNGKVLKEACTVDMQSLRQGVTLELANRILLVMDLQPIRNAPHPRLGFVGTGSGMERLRGDILKVADLDVEVSIRGESGAGKELVARALHANSSRRNQRLISINMAAISAATAASELFGHERGAFTGAQQRHHGIFEQAHKGTLFLDEIGAAPTEIQTMLLRVLETGEIRPVGSTNTTRVDVRLITATDSNLEEAVEAGIFSSALLHRIGQYVIELPPLRQRRSDIGCLFHHFLQQQLEQLGESSKLNNQEDPWLPAGFVAQLCSYPWPGNVRQLRNIARQVAIANRGSGPFSLPTQLQRLLSSAVAPLASAVAAPAAATAQPVAKKRRPADIDAAELKACLSENGWRIGPTAAALGIPKSSMYNLLKRHGIRQGSDLSREEIEQAMAAHGNNSQRAAAALEVSERALTLRRRHLGFADDT